MKSLAFILLTLCSLLKISLASDNIADATLEELLTTSSFQPGGSLCNHLLFAGKASQNAPAAVLCAALGLSTNLVTTSMILRTYEMANDDALNYEINHEMTDVLEQALNLELMRNEDQTLEDAIANIIMINSLSY